MSEKEQSNSSKKPRRPRRRRSKSNRSNSGNKNTQQNASPAAKNDRTSKSKNNRKRRRRSGPKLRPEERIFKKYDNLLEQHLHARRKYYDLFNRADPKQKEKLERNFYKTIADLRDFEASLKGNDLKIFLDRFEQCGELDRTYSQNHSIETDSEIITLENAENENGEVQIRIPSYPKIEEIEDPHFLEIQKAAKEDFKSDTEESVGSYEDYLAYKEQKSS